MQPRVHHGDFKAPLAASLASTLRPTLYKVDSSKFRFLILNKFKKCLNKNCLQPTST